MVYNNINTNIHCYVKCMDIIVVNIILVIKKLMYSKQFKNKGHIRP